MLIFGLHKGQRLLVDVSVGMKVKELREMIQKQLNIVMDNDKHDKKVLVLSWAGADLQDSWVFSDLGILPGTTIRVNLKEEVKPVLYIRCSHSQETLSVYDTLVIGYMHMYELRSLASRKTGLPVGIFRLVLKDGTEMYDGHLLEDYGLDVGDTVLLETLDGWSEFLNLAIMGFTPQVLSQISPEEFTGRYQMKVALFLAAHCGHVDLARAMLRQGIKASEPVGYPPQRMWCVEKGHVESKKTAVHQAVEMGQLGVLRVFVNNDITVLTAKDGEGLAPLNVALRKKVKNCASFLLTKQWSKINITKTFALHVGIYTCLRQWCDRAKERVFTKYGYSKSSLKRRPSQPGPLVGLGVSVDGFTPSIMTGKTKAQLQRDKDREKRKLAATRSVTQLNIPAEVTASGSIDPEAYFRQVVAIQNLKTMGDKVKGGKLGRITRTASKTKMAASISETATGRSTTTQKSPEPAQQHLLKVNSTTTTAPLATATTTNSQDDRPEPSETPRLPPIITATPHQQKKRSSLRVTQSQQSAISVSSLDADSVKDAAQLQQQQQRQQSSAVVSQVARTPSIGGGEERREQGRVMMPRLVTSTGRAYFMTSTSGSLQHQHQHQVTNPSLPPVVKVPILQLPSTDRSERGKTVDLDSGCHSDTFTTSRLNFVELTDTPSTPVDDGVTQQIFAKKDNPMTATHRTDATGPATSTRSLPADRRRRIKKKRVTSALLLSKATATEGTIPLPLISNERDRRPFFYYNGQREDTFVLPTISMWSKHTESEADSTPRERAIKSMSVANTFKEKPWLSQVRIAVKIATSPTKRTVRRLRPANKAKARRFAV